MRAPRESPRAPSWRLGRLGRDEGHRVSARRRSLRTQQTSLVPTLWSVGAAQGTLQSPAPPRCGLIETLAHTLARGCITRAPFPSRYEDPAGIQSAVISCSVDETLSRGSHTRSHSSPLRDGHQESPPRGVQTHQGARGLGMTPHCRGGHPRGSEKVRGRTSQFTQQPCLLRAQTQVTEKMVL